MASLTDPWGRRITRLRIAVTDACGFRCLYCMPAPVCRKAPAAALSADEVVRVAAAAVACGVRTVRLTGGEPLLRPDLPAIVSGISGLAPDLDVSLTTNGTLLAEQAERLAAAGLKRVNVSLDTLRPDRYLTITGTPGLDQALAGIEAARAAGLSPIKINAVVVRGLNDDEVADLVGFATERECHMRFIEFMPLDAGGLWSMDAVVTVDEIRARIEERFPLTPAGNGSGPGDDFMVSPSGGRVSLIGAVSRPFCHRCNRLRVTADGYVRGCLFSVEEHDLRPALAQDGWKAAVAAVFAAAVAGKPPSHCIGKPGHEQPRRTMSAIGG